MKGAIGITCLVWLLAGPAALAALPPLSFKPGTTYVYDVESTLLAGIPELQNQYSGFSIIYKLDFIILSPNKAIMQLREIRTGKINSVTPVSYEEDIDFHHSASPEYERELSKPIEVLYNDGLVEEFKAEASEPLWSINIKKAILSNFQLSVTKSRDPMHDEARQLNRPTVTVDPEDASIRVYEEGIGGECETWYGIFSIPSMDHPDQSEDVYNVTKTKNYLNCKIRPRWEQHNFLSQGCPDVCRQIKVQKYLPKYSLGSDKVTSAFDTGCRYGFQPDFHPVKSYSFTKYNISNASVQPVIDDIYNEGKTVYNYLGKELMVVVQQNFTLLKMKPLHAQPQVKNPVVYRNLSYELPIEKDLEYLEFAYYSIFGPIQGEELKEVVKKKLEDVAEDIIPDDPQSSEYLGTKIIELSNAFIVMKYEDLEDIYSQLESDKIEKLPNKEEIMRKVFLDLLGVAGTNVSAVFSMELIKAKRVSPSEAIELLEGIAKNLMYPNQTIIVELMELLDRPWISTNRLLFNSVALTIGKLIEEACVKPVIVPESCSPSKSIRKFSQSQVSEDESDEPEIPDYHPRKLSPEKRKHPRKEPVPEFDDDEEPSPVRNRRQSVYEPEDEDEDVICSEVELKEYVRAIARRLEKAETLAKKAIFIEALAHMASPHVLPILEPYIIGNATELLDLKPEDAEFLRTIAIYTLHHIIDYFPEEVLPLATLIYFNQSEGYELRIAAFTIIAESKPTLPLLEHIASDLWNENSNQLVSFVVSYLESVANSSLPCYRRLSQQIQQILAHAPDGDLGIQYSNKYSYDFYDDDNDYGVMSKIEYVASNVSNVPRSAYVSISHILGPFEDNLLEAGFNAKGLDDLWEKITRPGGILSQVSSQMGSNVQTKNMEDILETLKGKLAFNYLEPDIPRASIFFSLLGRTKYLTLDEQFILSIIEDFFNWFRQMDTTSGFSEHFVKVWMPSSFFKVVPSTLGFPVVVNHRNPIVVSLIIENARIAASEKKEVPMNSAFAFSTVIRPSIHVCTVVMAYAVSPAEDLLYGTAIERVYEVSVPLVLDVAIDLKKDNYALSLKPKLPHRFVYHRTRPTTFQAKAILIDVPKSEWLESVLEIETIPEAIKIDKRFEAKPLGLSLRIQAETEDAWGDIPFWLTPTAYDDGVPAALIEFLYNPELTPREFHVYLEPHVHEPASEFVVTLDYDRDIAIHGKDVEASSEESSSSERMFGEGYEQAMTKIYGPRYSISESEQTVSHLIEKTKATWAPVLGHVSHDPIPATISHNWKLTSAIKGPQSKHLALQLIYAHTLDHRSIWLQLHGHHSALGHSKVPKKICGSMVAVFPSQPNPFYLEMNYAHSLKAKVHAEVGWGAQCNQDNEIVITAIMEKSEEQLNSGSLQLDTDKNQQHLPWYFHECEVNRAEGRTQSEACQRAISEVSQLNRVDIKIMARQLPPMVRNLTSKIDLALKSYLYPNMEINPLAVNEENSVRIVIENIDQLQDLPLASVYLYKPYENVFFHKLYTPFYEPPSTLKSLEEIYGDMFFGGDYDVSCNLMEDHLSTFDNVTFELPDNKCQYLIAKDCTHSKDFAILASQIDLKSKTKVLAISVGPHTVKMFPPRGEEFAIVVDGVEKVISSRLPIALDFDTDSEMIIYVLDTVGPTDTPILVIETDEVDIQYDGKNAEITVPRSYKGDLCGLCGDFNEEGWSELVGPRGCTYVDAEDFANSYAISGQSCPKPPRPTGPAFCPNPKDQWEQNQLAKDEKVEDESSSEEPVHRPYKSRVSREDEDEEPDEEIPFARISKSKSFAMPVKKAKPEAVKIESIEEVIPTKPWSLKKQSSHKSSDEDDEELDEEPRIVRPVGPSRCIKQVTEFVETSNSTCFSTKPVYRCVDECSPVGRHLTFPVPMHCIPSDQSYVKDLKARARKTVIHQLLNKNPNLVAKISVPEKCSP